MHGRPAATRRRRARRAAGYDMDDEQRYLLDLQGFLHIPLALNAPELERCLVSVHLEGHRNLAPSRFRRLPLVDDEATAAARTA